MYYSLYVLLNLDDVSLPKSDIISLLMQERHIYSEYLQLSYEKFCLFH
ncbi:8533_t:CDS:2 [Cetraspora pellucida]|uniref:8533_t:CDS:1 n=1 Tax=Cetraspora pellucida TaxID=1433469 RepID=A0A9N8W9K6_9GLOM|nr:8533_t:CDS:2 [Cetraspora pellucida]